MSTLKLDNIQHPDAVSAALTFDSDGTMATATGFSSGGLKVKSSGGGTFSINPPSSASDRTLTLPDEAGTVITSGGSGNVTADMLSSTLDLSSKTITLPAANSPGLRLITSGTVDSVANLNVDNCFTSDYLNYKMHFNFNLADNALGDLDFGFYFRAGGSSKTDSNYQYSMAYKNLGVNADFNFSSTTGAGFIKLIDNIDGGDTHAVGWIDVYSPASTDGRGKSYIISELWTNDNGSNKIMWSQGVYTPDVAVDGFQLSTFNGGGTFDGSYQIYGYAL